MAADAGPMVNSSEASNRIRILSLPYVYANWIDCITMAVDRAVIAHLLRRATFGPTALEVDAAATAGVDATVESLLNPTGADTGAVATPIPDLGPDPYSVLPRQPSQQQRQAADTRRREQATALAEWWVARMVAAKHQLTEKMVFFWHGHWATSVEKVRSAVLMARQLETLRRYGRGDFALLLKAMVRDPALIVWLDGEQNTRVAPNENLARELMELFTLGIGTYTENDIRAGARALTGWVIDRVTGEASVDPRRHDATTMSILGTRATFDADSFADLLVAQPANGSFLARRLWLRFGSGAPVPDATLARLTAAYRPGRDITAMVRALFVDDAFTKARGELVKQPVEWAVGAMRQLSISPAALTGANRQAIASGLDALGQVPLKPPNVGGWPSGTAWLTTSSLQARVNVATRLAAEASGSVLNPIATGSTEARLDALARLLVVDGWTERTKTALTPASTDPRRLLTVGLVSPEYTVC